MHSVALPAEGNNVLSLTGPVLTPEQEQERWLFEAIETVRESADAMHTHIQQRNLKAVWSSAATMLGELCTDVLAPQYYYELYVKVFDELQLLANFIREEHTKGRSLERMYETVQHTGRIVPRLYLLVTVGSVCIESGEQPALETMHDLIEMCKGVQHPTRGLFLRNFLLTMMKNKLPGDSGCPAAVVESAGGSAMVRDTAELILQNLNEMNWLWIRMEGRHPARVESQRALQRKHRDRKELCVLVGMNIVRISQLEGVERDAYASGILPRLLGIILMYREPLAQQYLLEVIVQVFPDEFHLFTLSKLLDALGDAAPGVDVSAVLAALMQRLGRYAALLRDGVVEASDVVGENHMQTVFDEFKNRLEAMMDASKQSGAQATGLGNSGVLQNAVRRNDCSSSSLSVAQPSPPITLVTYVKSMHNLVDLAFKINPTTAPEQVGLLLKCVSQRLPEQLKDTAAQTVEKMVVSVIETMKIPMVVLEVECLDQIIQQLPLPTRRTIACFLCETFLKAPSNNISSLSAAARLFELIAPLVYDDPSAGSAVEAERHGGSMSNRRNNKVSDTPTPEQLMEEQQLVCRVIHLLHCDDVATQMKIMNGVRKQVAKGGSQRNALVMLTLASLYIRLALRIRKNALAEAEATQASDYRETADESEEPAGSADPVAILEAAGVLCAKVFYLIHSGDGKGMLELIASEVPQQTFYLYVASGRAADTCGLPEVAYEHFVKAFLLYEESAGETTEQNSMLNYIISSLCTVQSMSEEAYECLATKVCQYSSKLLQKSDQSRAVAHCAQLFWKKGLSEDNQHRVVECLQRALKIANNINSQSQRYCLAVDLLGLILRYYAGQAPGVTTKHVTTLLDLADEDGRQLEQSEEGEHGADLKGAMVYYRNTLRYISARKEVDIRWSEIELPGDTQKDAGPPELVVEQE
ncbi:putative Vacuolar protein sorting associated protein 35 [Trypanosoma vivax]|nr:putative Vacuolar protein sorting associated protein 35 [Trypanosoma vivax]